MNMLPQPNGLDVWKRSYKDAAFTKANSLWLRTNLTHVRPAAVSLDDAHIGRLASPGDPLNAAVLVKLLYTTFYRQPLTRSCQR